MVVIHSTKPALKRPLTAISIKLTVQLPPAKVRNPRARPSLNHIGVHRIEDDYGIVAHAQRRSGVDPVSLPATSAQRRVNLGGVFAALTTDQSIAARESLQDSRVMERRAVPASLGAAPPTLDVEKNTGSMPEKSFSSRIRCRRTLPTIPRQPMNPTRNMLPPNAEISR